MPALTTYLKHLRFDPKLYNSLYAKYLRNTRLVLLVVILVVLIGIFSFVNLPRVLNPQIKIPIVIVSTILPGASPDDVESLVTIPIEDSVSSLQKVKTVTSSSQDSVSVVTLEFESGVEPDKAKADVKSAVDSVTDLPENAEAPTVMKLDFENEPIWTFVLSSDGDYLSLVRFGKILRDGLKDLSKIDKVSTIGLEDEEIQIVISPEKMALYGINPAALTQSIKAATGSFPAGSINTENSSFVLTADPTVTSVSDLRKIRISSQKTTLFLSDIADIQRRIKPDAATSYIATHDKQAFQTVRFDVYKTSSANITDAVAQAQHLAEKMTAEYGKKFTISTVFNSRDQIDRQYYDLIRDLFITVILVFLTLFLFLGLRQALVASIAIPLTFLITFIVMHGTGVALSFIAFFSLLLSLGLLVDDTIVVISALTAYYRTEKFTPLEAGLLVWRDFRTAILTTTLTTVWAFVPLLLSTGIIGEFIKAIPIVVSSTLLGSFFVAVFITMPFIIFLLGAKPPQRVIILLRILGIVALFWLFLLLAPKGPLFIPAIILFVINLFIYFQVRSLLFRHTKKYVIPVNTGIQKLDSRVRGNDKREVRNEKWRRYINHGVINFEKFEKKISKYSCTNSFK